MLRIMVEAKEMFDEQKQEFIDGESRELLLEHSLVAISKWEAKWCKTFLSKTDKTRAETVDYIRCMTLTEDVEPEVYARLTDENIDEINKYIEAPMTATRVEKHGKRSSGELTSEVIYYYMIALGIPFECQYWHLNRLMKLIEVCNAKSTPPKKMSRQEILARNAVINKARRAKLGSKG